VSRYGAVIWSLPPAIGCALLLSRRFPGRMTLDGLVHLPVILPPVLTGFLLLLLLGRRGPVGAWLEGALGIHLVFTREGAILATAVMTFPLLVRAIRIAFQSMGRTPVRGRVAAARQPVRPLFHYRAAAGRAWHSGRRGSRPFAAGMGEFGAVITFAANIPGETQTLPLAIYALLQQPGGEAAALRLAAMSFALAMTGLIGAELLQRWMLRRLAG
jgi:molybdate transport system permease protein